VCGRPPISGPATPVRICKADHTVCLSKATTSTMARIGPRCRLTRLRSCWVNLARSLTPARIRPENSTSDSPPGSRVFGVCQTASVPPHAAGAMSPGACGAPSSFEAVTRDPDGPATLRALCQAPIRSASPPNRYRTRPSSTREAHERH
jgi:hypothetical protein